MHKPRAEKSFDIVHTLLILIPEIDLRKTIAGRKIVDSDRMCIEPCNEIYVRRVILFSIPEVQKVVLDCNQFAPLS